MPLVMANWLGKVRVTVSAEVRKVVAQAVSAKNWVL